MIGNSRIPLTLLSSHSNQNHHFVLLFQHATLLRATIHVRVIPSASFLVALAPFPLAIKPTVFSRTWRHPQRRGPHQLTSDERRMPRQHGRPHRRHDGHARDGGSRHSYADRWPRSHGKPLHHGRIERLLLLRLIDGGLLRRRDRYRQLEIHIFHHQFLVLMDHLEAGESTDRRGTKGNGVEQIRPIRDFRIV